MHIYQWHVYFHFVIVSETAVLVFRNEFLRKVDLTVWLCKRGRTWAHSVSYDIYPAVYMLDINESLEVGGILVAPFIHNWRPDDIFCFNWQVSLLQRSQFGKWKHAAITVFTTFCDQNVQHIISFTSVDNLGKF